MKAASRLSPLASRFPPLASRLLLILLAFSPLTASAIIDADSDGMSDLWEALYGFSTSDNGTLTTSQAPNSDPDGDGVTNLNESIAGTSPLLADGVNALFRAKLSASTKTGYTDFEGSFFREGAAGDACPMNSSVMDMVTVSVPRPGPPKLPDAQIKVPSFVGLNFNCRDISVAVLLFGSGNRKAAMVGRATVTNKNTGAVTTESVLVGRAE